MSIHIRFWRLRKIKSQNNITDLHLRHQNESKLQRKVQKPSVCWVLLLYLMRLWFFFKLPLKSQFRTDFNVSRMDLHRMVPSSSIRVIKTNLNQDRGVEMSNCCIPLMMMMMMMMIFCFYFFCIRFCSFVQRLNFLSHHY